MSCPAEIVTGMKFTNDCKYLISASGDRWEDAALRSKANLEFDKSEKNERHAMRAMHLKALNKHIGVLALK